MLGRIEYIQGKGRQQPALEEVCGIACAKGTLFEPEGLRPWRVRRRLQKLRRFFLDQGVRRVLFPGGFPYRSAFFEFGQVDPMPFYRGAADLLVLGSLRVRGIEPGRAVAALSAPRLCPELTAAAERLCPQVRGLLIDVPGDGERYAAWLHRQYGLPVASHTRADVTAAFGPGGGRWGSVLHLYGARASLAEVEITVPGIDLPADCGEQVMAALWELGRLDRGTIQVCRRNPS